LQVNHIAVHFCQLRQTHFGAVSSDLRAKSVLGQTPLQRHLTAFETDLVIATGTGFLAFVTPCRGLAKAGPRAPPYTPRRVLAAFSRLDAIQTHAHASSTSSMKETLLIMPLFSGVSST